MIWKGVPLNNTDELLQALVELAGPEEGLAFMEAYRRENQNADRHVGYSALYLGRKAALRIWELTGTEHPIVGRQPYEDPQRLLVAGMVVATFDRAGYGLDVGWKMGRAAVQAMRRGWAPDFTAWPDAGPAELAAEISRVVRRYGWRCRRWPVPDRKSGWVPWEDPKFVLDVKRNLFPKVRDTDVFLSLCPSGEPDVKFLIELGAAVWYGKPIVTVAVGGVMVPKGLRDISKKVVRGPTVAKAVEEAMQAISDTIPDRSDE